MALVILTGLTTSTVLNMIVVPAPMAQWGGPPPVARAALASAASAGETEPVER
jgi:hypothetical protein